MKKVLIAVGLILFIILAGVSFWQKNKMISAPKQTDIDSKSDWLKVVLVSQSDGSSQNLEAFRGKVIILSFWATWCDACVEELPSIIRLKEKLKDQPFEVVSINLDDAPDSVLPGFLEKYRINFPIFFDKEEKLASHFNVVGLPFNALLDHNLNVVSKETGAQEWDSSEMLSKIQILMKAINPT